MQGYCPKCRSRLYPVDEEYMRKHGVCSYCVTVQKLNRPKPKKKRPIIRIFKE